MPISRGFPIPENTGDAKFARRPREIMQMPEFLREKGFYANCADISEFICRQRKFASIRAIRVKPAPFSPKRFVSIRGNLRKPTPSFPSLKTRGVKFARRPREITQMPEFLREKGFYANCGDRAIHLATTHTIACVQLLPE